MKRFAVGDYVRIRTLTPEECETYAKMAKSGPNVGAPIMSPEALQGCRFYITAESFTTPEGAVSIVLRPHSDARAMGILKGNAFCIDTESILEPAPFVPPHQSSVGVGDLRPYSVPVPVRVTSVQGFIAEVKFPDGHRECVDVAHLGHKLEEVDNDMG